MDGYEVLKKLRSAKIKTPVLILSGQTQLDSKIKGLGFGADDYITKPFNARELIARIQAIVRRSQGHSHSLIKVGNMTVDLQERSVEIDGKKVALTNKEYSVLELLSVRRGTTITKEVILNHLYNGMDEPEGKIVDVFVCKLRKKLSKIGGEEYIDTVWGRGYALREPVPSSAKLR
jgi:two-component system cell cycle response regulator CtrA